VALDAEVSQRRILYRVGIVDGQYNIAEVYSRSDSTIKIFSSSEMLTAPIENLAVQAKSASCPAGSTARMNINEHYDIEGENCFVSRTALRPTGVFVLDCSTEVKLMI
jgi:hypothetical protein